MITIYGRANSINVRKVLWLCEDIDVKFERLDYGRGFKDANSPELLALNPHAMVPVVVDGKTAIWESNTCLRYLNGKYGTEDIYPKDVTARAQVDQWMDWQLGHFQPAITPIFFARHLKNPDVTPEAVKAAIERTGKMMKILSDQIDGAGGHIAGPKITLADYAIGPGVHRWYTLVPETAKMPPLEAYYKRLSERPGYKKFVLIGAP